MDMMTNYGLNADELLLLVAGGDVVLHPAAPTTKLLLLDPYCHLYPSSLFVFASLYHPTFELIPYRPFKKIPELG